MQVVTWNAKHGFAAVATLQPVPAIAPQPACQVVSDIGALPNAILWMIFSEGQKPSPEELDKIMQPVASENKDKKKECLDMP